MVRDGRYALRDQRIKAVLTNSSFQTTTKTVEILHHCWGSAKQGELVGIMGSSGAGKTTLLNSLSGRLRRAGGVKFQGIINVLYIRDMCTHRTKGLLRDGEQTVTPVALRQTAAYVRQDDILLDTLTVREVSPTFRNRREPCNFQ